MAAPYHVWSGNGGTPTPPYDTWAKAATSFLTVSGLTVAGDTIYVAHDHAETTGTGGLSPSNGTAGSPVKVVCGTRTGTSGISALATTAAITVNVVGVGYGGPGVYCYGMIFICSNSGLTTLRLGGSATSSGMFESCQFIISGSNNGSRIAIGQSSTSYQPRLYLKNCGFKFASTLQAIDVDGNAEIMGGSWIAGGLNPTGGIFQLSASGRGCGLNISGFDFSALSSGVELFREVGNGGFVRARNIKMPASWVPASTWDGGGGPSGSARAELYNYSVGTGDTNYRFHCSDAQGTVSEETSIYRTANGAQDEVTKYSWKMTCTPNCSWPSQPLRSMPIIKRVNVAGGASKTVNIHITTDNATHFDNKHVWIEVEYLGTSGSAVSSIASNSPDFVTNATSYTASGEAWTGTSGFASARNELLTSPLITFQENGYYSVTVCLADSAIKTIYVDPNPFLA